MSDYFDTICIVEKSMFNYLGLFRFLDDNLFEEKLNVLIEIL